MRMKNCLSILLAVVMIATMITSLPITANAADIEAAATAAGKTFVIKSADDLNPALTEINDATEESKFVIDLQTNLTNCGISISNSKAEVTIIGNGHSIQAPSQVVCVENGATVNLGDSQSELIIMGYDESHTTETGKDDPGLVYVLQDSTCNMNDKVTLKNHKGNNYLGGGVSVKGGTFNMNGGTIQNCGIDGGSVCYGGGVAVYNGGHFTMNGGTIDHCYAITTYIEEDPQFKNSYSGIGGGVFVTDGSEFIMNGGTISNNTATNFGGGVAMTLSDVETIIDPETGKEKINPETGKGYVDLGNPRSNVTIYGGLICGNKAKNGAGVFASGLIFAYANAFSKLPLESGTPENPGLYINRGENKSVEISSNTASDTGGGVLAIGLKDPKRVDIKNTDISSNHAKSGAGISVYYYWTKAMIENCHIHDNTASTLGGGIYLEDNKDLGAGTTIKNTVIENNTAGEKGGGIYYTKGSVLNIEGADIIQNNTVDEKDNNLYFQGTKFPVNVTGSLEGSRIGVTDAKLFEDNLDDYDPEAESSDSLTEGFKAQNPSLIPDGTFTSDHESWYADFGVKDATPKITYNYKATKYKNNVGTPEGYFTETAFDGKSVFLVDISDVATPEELAKISKSSITSPLIIDLLGRRLVADGYSKYNVSNPYDRYYRDSKNGIILNIWLYDYFGGSVDSPEDSYTTTILTQNNNNAYIIFLQAAGEVQNQYGEAGKIALLIQSSVNGYKTIDSSLFENVSAEEDTLVLDAPLDFGNDSQKTIYKYALSGAATTKYVINKNDNPNPKTENEVVNYDYTNEVRLVRKETVDYHINNDVIDDKYGNSDIFTDEITKAGTTVEVGKPITSFYTVPEVVPTAQNTCPYIFKGWYYDKYNENDSRPVHFDTDTYTAGHDIYAHWIKVDNVDKDSTDEYILPNGNTYGGFDLAGVQIREGVIDTNFDSVKKPGGMRFITSLSKKVVSEINKLKSGGNNIEYGYVTASATNEGWIKYHDHYQRKLQYVSDSANGIDTSSSKAPDETYFGFAKNVNCTSKESNSSSEEFVKEDHRSYDGYLLYTLVVTYEGATEADKAKNVLARPYIHYTDANGLERVAYSDYNGNRNKLGGCYISYKDVK